MDKILFVSLNLFAPSPRSIRCKEITQYLSQIGVYEIHILNFTERECDEKTIKFVKIFNKSITFWDKLRNSVFNSNPRYNEKSSNKAAMLNFIAQFGTQLSIKNLFFPDIYFVELRRLKQGLKSLLKKHDYRIIIYLISPFTFYSLGKLAKKYSAKSALVYDIGDPLYGNGTLKHRLLKRNLAKIYERNALEFCDALIVTNSTTRAHFLATYPNQLANKKVFIIPQGTIIPKRLPKLDSHKSTELNKPHRLSLVYAGTFYENLRDPRELFGVINSLGQDEFVLEIFGVNSRKFISDNMLSGKGAIRFKGLIDNSALQKKYQQYDALVYIDNAYGVQTSSKLFELIAAKKPILFIYNNENSSVLEMIKNYGGVVLARNERKAIKAAIQKIKINYHLFNYEFDISGFAWENRAYEYSKALYHLTASPL